MDVIEMKKYDVIIEIAVQQKLQITDLCECLHDLLGQWDGRDPGTNGPIDLETSGARIRKAQAVLVEVE